jgi:glycosyltransferase involved in cell wall biosynthesis
VNKKEPNIGLVTWPILTAGVVPLQRLIHVLHPLSNELHVITGGAACDIFIAAGHRVYPYLIDQESTANTFLRVMGNISTQLKISWRLCKIARHVDFWIFFFGGPVLLLPMLTAKLLLKDVVLAFTGSAPEDMRAQVGSFISKIVGFLTEINCTLSSRIVIYSESLIKTWGLERYEHKISIAHEHFLDFDKFKVQRPLNKRDNLIGYIGRLSEEKGILNFVEAIPRVLETRDDAAFLIGGDGQLRSKVEENADKLSNNVKYAGWILHNELPHYLNELKLLVLPSYTEGLPNIMLEAMACGTPVLATPVGSIPDVVKDGETGFIMKDNSPEGIARNVIRALTHSNLETIVTNAHTLVEKEFTYEKAVERYRDILARLMAKEHIEAT